MLCNCQDHGFTESSGYRLLFDISHGVDGRCLASRFGEVSELRKVGGGKRNGTVSLAIHAGGFLATPVSRGVLLRGRRSRVCGVGGSNLKEKPVIVAMRISHHSLWRNVVKRAGQGAASVYRGQNHLDFSKTKSVAVRGFRTVLTSSLFAPGTTRFASRVSVSYFKVGERGVRGMNGASVHLLRGNSAKERGEASTAAQVAGS